MIEIDPYVRFACKCVRSLLYSEMLVAYDFRIFFMLRDGCSVEFTDRLLEMPKYSLLLIPPATPYRLLFRDETAEYFNLNFDLDSRHAETPSCHPVPVRQFDRSLLISTYMLEPFSKVLFITEAQIAEEPLRKIVEEKHMNLPIGAYSNELASAFLKEVLVTILRLQSRRRAPKLVWEIEAYIQANYRQPVTNTTIADRFKYHSYYLNRLFLASTGKTIHQTLIACRLKAASRLLVSTNDPVGEIAVATGFVTASYFAKYFKAAYGLSPLAFRKQNQVY